MPMPVITGSHGIPEAIRLLTGRLFGFGDDAVGLFPGAMKAIRLPEREPNGVSFHSL